MSCNSHIVKAHLPDSDMVKSQNLVNIGNDDHRALDVNPKLEAVTDVASNMRSEMGKPFLTLTDDLKWRCTHPGYLESLAMVSFWG